MRIDKEEHRTALLDFIDQIAENVAFPDYFDKEVAELRAAIREAKIEEQDRIAVLQRERDELREALRETVSVLADYVNDEDPTLRRARAALEAKP